MATVVLPGIISAALHICDPVYGQILNFLLHAMGLHVGLCISDVNGVI